MALDELQNQKPFGGHWSLLEEAHGDVRGKNITHLLKNKFPVNYRTPSKKHFKFPGNFKPILGNESVVSLWRKRHVSSKRSKRWRGFSPDGMYMYTVYSNHVFILDLYVFVPFGYVSASYYPTSGMKRLTNDNWIAVLDMLWTAMKSALESLQSGHVQTDWWDTATVTRHQVGSEIASLVKFCDISWCFVIQCRQATREFERRSLQRVKSIGDGMKGIWMHHQWLFNYESDSMNVRKNSSREQQQLTLKAEILSWLWETKLKCTKCSLRALLHLQDHLSPTSMSAARGQLHAIQIEDETLG